MTKQEEIREGMWEFILEVRQYLCNTEFAPEPFTEPVDFDVLREMGNAQLKKMDSQGVVVKVDRELPKNRYVAPKEIRAGEGVDTKVHNLMSYIEHRSERETAMNWAYAYAQDDMGEAGYVAVEPLIEERK